MQYFLPFWPGDNIYEEFDPWKDTWRGREKMIWQAFTKPPLDGVLVSLANVKQTNQLRKKAENNDNGIHGALGFYGPVMGDCGAFSYVAQPEPPDPIQTLAYYKKLGFDICVTVDHLIVNTIKISKDEKHELTDEEKEYRQQITIENAKKMFNESQKSIFDGIRLIGAVQGLNPTSFADGARELLEYGFDYIGLGGLARKSTKYVQKVLLGVAEEIRKHLKREKLRNGIFPKIGLHLFGVARPNLFETMIKCGVTSFDSASPLRIAWISSKKNYKLGDEFYTAFRIPIAKKEEKQQEQRVWQRLKDFDKGRITTEEFLKELASFAPRRFTPREKEIQKTLKDKPWEKCDCPMCQEIGIHICIFRGCERNMRRGFHNVYQFHKLLHQRFPHVLVLTWCTSKKNPDTALLPSYKRYMASNLFKTFWNNVYDLPVDVGVLSAKYMLIHWDTKISDYEETLVSNRVSEAVGDLRTKLDFYDKVFFIGLGKYREAVQRAAERLNVPVEIFPKKQLSRGKLDIIEYNRQIGEFRNTILSEVGPYLQIIKNDEGYEQTELLTF